MFQKDTLRLIGKTFNRFFSLLMIVLIGVSFMMGLLSTRQIMEDSVDIYNDEYNLQDIQLYSSYGFDDNDIAAIKSQEYVEDIFPSRMIDVFCRAEGTEDVYVCRVEETLRKVNKYNLIEGRMPNAYGEALVLSTGLNDSRYKIGDKLTVFLADEDISEKLRVDEFEVVGLIESPAYFAKTLGTSTLNNLDLDMVIFTIGSTFKTDYYTTVYLTLKDIKDLNSFTREYEDAIDGYKADITVFAKRQQTVLKDKILAEYQEKITESETLLEEKRAEAQAQLDDAKQKLDDANIQIIASQAQLDSLNTILNATTDRVVSLNNQMAGAFPGIEQTISKVEADDAQHRSFDQIYAELLTDYGTYSALKSMSNQGTQDLYSDSIANVQSENAALNTRLTNELIPRRDALNTTINSEETSEEDKQTARSELIVVEQEIAVAQQQISANERMIENLRTLQQSQEASSPEVSMKVLDDKYGGSIEETYQNYSKIVQDRIAWEALKSEVDLANEALARVGAEISQVQRQLDSGKKEYERGVKEYQESFLKFTEEMENAESEIKKAKQELEELPDAEWMILTRDSHYSSYLYKNNAKQMGAIGVSLPVLFYLVAALVCMTTMTRLIDEQRGQIGIFRALGFSKGQIIGKYVEYAVIASTIGSVIGIFAGMKVFPTVIYKTWRLMYYLPEMHLFYPMEYVVLCVFAFTLLMIVVTVFVVNRSLSEQPSQLMRPKSPKSARKVFLEYIPFLWKKLSFTSKITARNLIRYKVRFLMTVIGVAGCTGLLVVGWGIKDSISDVVAIQFGQIFNYDYIVSLDNDRAVDGLITNLETDLNNEYIVPYMQYSSKVYLDGEEPVISVEVLDARAGNDIYNLRNTSHTEEVRMNNGGVIVSQKFAINNNLKAGDYITIESSKGLKAEVKINDICEMYFQHYLFISTDYYSLIFDEPIHYTNVAVKNTVDGSDLLELPNKRDDVKSVTDFSAMTEQFNIMIEALDYIILVIILTAGALAFVVLINLTQVNISERTREIATLKVLGFRNNEVERYLFNEIFMMAVIGGLVGLPLGVVEHHFIMNIINMEMIMFGMNIKLLSFAYAFGITILFTLIVLLLTKKPLRDIKMIESLKSVE